MSEFIEETKLEVELVSMTQPMVKGIKTAEEFIAYQARVSNPNNQLNNDTAEGLLSYCARKKHWSIFDMVDMTFSIKCPRDIGRQILRHQSCKFQEFSQRYAKVDPDSMFTNRETRLQDLKNRQASLETDDMELSVWFTEAQNYIKRVSTEYYLQSLELGIAKEQARCILPEGLTMSHMYMKGSLRSFIHYCEVRCAEETQKEHRIIAQQIREHVLEHFPSLKSILGV